MAQDLLFQDSPLSFVVHQPSEFMFLVVSLIVEESCRGMSMKKKIMGAGRVAVDHTRQSTPRREYSY